MVDSFSDLGTNIENKKRETHKQQILGMTLVGTSYYSAIGVLERKKMHSSYAFLT